jgi:hypothetical protein
MSKNNSRDDLLAADQKMIDGITKHQAELPPSLTVGSVVTTPQEVIAAQQDRIAKGKAVIQAEAAKTAAVKAERESRTASQRKLAAFRRLIIAMFFDSPDILADFGLVAPKPPARTSANKAGAAARGLATRKLLGTKGSRQKKAALAAAGAPVEAPVSPAPSPTAAGASPAPSGASPAPAAAAPAQPASAIKPVS